MKISRIEIKDYNQFKDFTLDLTYPAGHEKAGQPLDKVCFIGQSGTGKTTLLNICNDIKIIEHYYTHYDRSNNRPSTFQMSVTFDFEGKAKQRITKRNIEPKFTEDYLDNDLNIINRDKIDIVLQQGKYHNDKIIDTILFPAEMMYNINQILESQPLENPLNYIATDENIKQSVKKEREQLEEKSVYDFGKDNPAEIWKAILIDSSDYMVEELSYSQRITKALLKDINKANELVEQFKEWQKAHPNPIKELADKCLNPILNKFHLEVKTDFDFEKAEDLKFIKIQTLDGREVPYSAWSTGTKHIIFKATPLYKLNTNKTIVLMDEPETSLYPDIQTMIINYYTKLAPNAQFFFATHSPLIASSFAPWEIVELKFNKEGYVYQEPYYEGERHVDNYTIDPRYLTWSNILLDVFDLKEEGNETFRVKALTRASRLKAKLQKLKNENKINTTDGKKTLEEFEELAKKLAWKFEYEEN